MKRFSFTCLLLIFVGVQPTITLLGDLISPNSTFSFNLLNKLVYDPQGETLYTATQEDIVNPGIKPYGISFLLRNKKVDIFVPLLNENASINGNSQSNPLWGKALAHLALGNIAGKYTRGFIPLTVSAENPNTVYGILSSTKLASKNNVLVASDPLPDSASLTASKIVNIAHTPGGFIAAVCKNGTNFADTGSNSALIGRTITEEVNSTENINNVNTVTSVTYHFTPSYAITFDGNLPALSLDGNPVTLTAQTPPLHTSLQLGKSYVGSAISAGKGRAVTILDQEIIPAAACGADSVIASTTEPVAAYDLTTFYTSTDLVYLAVLGGVGSGGALPIQNQVYALPLVSSTSDSNLLGKIASKAALPSLVYASYYPHALQRVGLETPALTTADTYTSTDIPVRVGGGPLELSTDDTFTIEKIFAQDDAVFAHATYTGTNTGSSGLFYSQALFDQTGRIGAWSPWKRKTLIGDYQYIFFATKIGSFYAIPGSTPSGSIVQPAWSQDPFFDTFTSTNLRSTPAVNGGIQGLIDIPRNYPNNTVDSPSFVIQTGYQTIIIQQTALSYDAVTSFPSSTFTCSDGTLAGWPGQATTLVSSGGELEKGGALITATLGFEVNTGTGALEDSWFFAGGTAGVFALCSSNGDGYGATGPGENLANITNTMAWQPLGNFSQVKKLWYDEGYLYILTNTTLARIQLSSSTIAQGKGCPHTLLAQASDFSSLGFASFADVIVSARLAILATSAGLFRIGNNADIRSATDSSQCGWTKIDLPEGPISAVYLYPLTRTGIQADFSKSGDTLPTGNILVLSGSFGTHQGRVYRFVAYDSLNNAINDDTFVPIVSYFIKDRPSYFFDPKSARLSVTTDGANWFMHFTQSLGLFSRAFLQVVPANLHLGVPSLGSFINVPLASLEVNTGVGPATFISGKGIWASNNLLGASSLR